MYRPLFYLKNAGFLRTCKKHIKIPCLRLPCDACWQRHCTYGGTKLQPHGVGKAPRFVVKWVKQKRTEGTCPQHETKRPGCGGEFGPISTSFLEMKFLKINLGRTGKLQEMTTTDCWSWKSLQHLRVKLQIPTSSAPNNPGLASKFLCKKELRTRYCNMLSENVWQLSH